MRSGLILPSCSVALLLIATFFAVDRYAAMEEARTATTAAHEQLALAQDIAQRHPEAFGVNANHSAVADLKRLVQDSAARNGVSLLYLTETERDAGESIRERNVLARLVNVPHDKLVSLLADLETKGGGARIKEIRIKPSIARSDVYQEAEAVLTVRWITSNDTAKEKSK
jgi:hypothetical protein